MIAQSLQFRRDRMFEVRAKTPSSGQLRTAVFASLAISIVAYVAMAAGWVACFVELDRGRDSSFFDTAIIVGLSAAVVALTRGGIHALMMSHFERGDAAKRDLEARQSQDVAADRGSRHAVARDNSGEDSSVDALHSPGLDAVSTDRRDS
jgi:hypothetical protein